MSVQPIVKRPTAADVRAHAIAVGLAQPGNGRLSDAAIASFNANRRGIHRFVRNEKVRTHTVKPPKGRSITRNYRVKDARAWAVENGHSEQGQRGRMSKKILDLYILSLVDSERETA